MRFNTNYIAREILRRKELPKTRLLTPANVFVVVSVALLVYLFFGSHGFLKIITTQRAVTQTENQIRALESQRKELEREAAKIKDNPHYKEKIARERFGLAQKNEVVYRVKKKKPE